MKLKQIIVGVYEFGFESVQIILREGNGGEFYFIPELGHIGRIKIGVDGYELQDVISILLHEAMEYSLTRLQCRYLPSAICTKEANQYLFTFNHFQYSEACQQVGELLTVAMPDVIDAFSAFYAKPKKSKKSKKKK